MENAAARRRRAEDDYVRRAPGRPPLRAVPPPRGRSAAVAESATTPRPATRPDPDRRTIQISSAPAPRRRRPAPAASRAAARPDRLALWAVVLALFLAFVAAASGRGDDSDRSAAGRADGAVAPIATPR